MPRPKRTKVAPSAPAPRIRQPTKVATKGPISKKLSPDNIYDVSDPDEGVLRSAQRVKKNKYEGKGKGKAPEERGRDANNSPPRAAMEELDVDNASGAMFDDIDLDSSSIEVSRREVNTPLIENSRMSLANFRRRPRQPSILGRGPARARSSSIESNLAEDNGLTSVGRRNTSGLGMGNARGRQRQTSVTRNPPYIAPSSMALEMERGTPAHARSVLGNFKRRAREPSILGTGQKRHQQRPDFDDDDEDDFNPDDESTPLNFNRPRDMNASPEVAAGSSSNPRKRKLSDIQVPRSSPSLPSPIATRTEVVIQATMSDLEREEGGENSEDEEETDEESLPEELELPMPSIESRPITPELLSETMAPPRSSSSSSPASPEPPPPVRRQISRPAPTRGRQLRGRTPPPRTQDSPISSPPSLTHSPNRPIATGRQRPRKLVPPPSTFSTAQLQTLMAQRRRRRPNNDPFNVPSSDNEIDVTGLASDDDELSHLAARPRRKPIAAPATRNKGKGKAVSNSNSRNAAGANRTYGTTSRVSDKENENDEVDADDSLAPLPDDDGEHQENSQDLEKRVGVELKRAVRKFAEVDRWELDFEDVTASSDSHRDAR